jgi:hypothetical protein
VWGSRKGGSRRRRCFFFRRAPLFLSSHLLKVKVAGVARALRAFELKRGRQLVLVVAARVAEDAAAHAAVVLTARHGKLAGAVDTVLCVLVVLPHGRHSGDAVVKLCHCSRRRVGGGERVCGSMRKDRCCEREGNWAVLLKRPKKLVHA